MKNIKYRVGVDIGGTFTDIVIYGDDASVYTKKYLQHKMIMG